MRAVSYWMIATASLFVACAEDPNVSSNVQGVNTLNKLSVNKLSVNKLSVNKLSVNKLSVNLASAGDLLSTPDGREVMSYVVSCALPEGLTLVADFMGAHYEFPGEIGLAPSWVHHPLRRQGRGWISACLFARVNAHDVALPISLRGPSHALATTPDERAGWSVEEGAFYGDFFTPGTSPIIWIACRGEGQASGEFGGLVDRDCAEPDPADPTKTQCGFTYAGDCGAFAAHHACEQFSTAGTFYRRCHASSSVDSHDEHEHYGHHGHHDGDDGDDDDDDDDDTTYRQVITTFVTP